MKLSNTRIPKVIDTGSPHLTAYLTALSEQGLVNIMLCLEKKLVRGLSCIDAVFRNDGKMHWKFDSTILSSRLCSSLVTRSCRRRARISQRGAPRRLRSSTPARVTWSRRCPRGTQLRRLARCGDHAPGRLGQREACGLAS